MLHDLPVLQQSRWLRFSTLCALYVSQGLPVGLFQVAIPAWFAAEGLSLAEVGAFIAIAFLPWSFKLLAGPIMDKFSFPPMGRRRPWVLFAQSGLVASFLVMMLFSPDPSESYYLLAAMGFACNFFGALQDVAVDGMAIDILEEDERAQANAYMFGGQVAGTSLAGAVGSAALMNFGLAVASAAMAFGVFLIMLVPLVLRERTGERMLPWSEGEPSPEALENANPTWLGIISTLFRALILPMSILLILLEALNRMAAGVVLAIGPVLVVQELNWIQADYANWVAISGVVAAVLGVLAGPIIDKVGAKPALGVAIGCKFLLFAVVASTASWWSNPDYIKVFLMGNYLSGQLVTISIIALFMRLCFKQVAATQFAIYMASANLTLSLGSGIVGPLGAVFDYAGMLYFVAGLNLVFLLLLPLLNFERHEQALARMGQEQEKGREYAAET